MKNAVIFSIGPVDGFAQADLSEFDATPPTGQQWRTIGLKPTDDFDLSCFHVERHERVLPGAVINREAEARFIAYEEQTGRKPGKKQRAIIKGDVVDDLLPMAFVRVSHIPVSIVSGLLIVWVSSIPKADEVVSLLVGIFNQLGIETKIEFKPIEPGLATVALGKHGALLPGRTVVLTGPEKQKVRVKALDVESHRVQPLIEVDNYHVNEIGVALGDSLCVITDKGIVKNIDLGDSQEDEAGVWLFTNFIKRLVAAANEDEL